MLYDKNNLVSDGPCEIFTMQLRIRSCYVDKDRSSSKSNRLGWTKIHLGTLKVQLVRIIWEKGTVANLDQGGQTDRTRNEDRTEKILPRPGIEPASVIAPSRLC